MELFRLAVFTCLSCCSRCKAHTSTSPSALSATSFPAKSRASLACRSHNAWDHTRFSCPWPPLVAIVAREHCSGPFGWGLWGLHASFALPRWHSCWAGRAFVTTTSFRPTPPISERHLNSEKIAACETFSKIRTPSLRIKQKLHGTVGTSPQNGGLFLILRQKADVFSSSLNIKKFSPKLLIILSCNTLT